MDRCVAVTVACALAMAFGPGDVFAQAKPACDPQGRVVTPQKVEGQVVKIDPGRNKVTVREMNGSVHEFEASAETLQELKVGDRINARLREAPKCP